MKLCSHAAACFVVTEDVVDFFALELLLLAGFFVVDFVPDDAVVGAAVDLAPDVALRAAAAFFESEMRPGCVATTLAAAGILAIFAGGTSAVSTGADASTTLFVP